MLAQQAQGCGIGYQLWSGISSVKEAMWKIVERNWLKMKMRCLLEEMAYKPDSVNWQNKVKNIIRKSWSLWDSNNSFASLCKAAALKGGKIVPTICILHRR